MNPAMKLMTSCILTWFQFHLVGNDPPSQAKTTNTTQYKSSNTNGFKQFSNSWAISALGGRIMSPSSHLVKPLE